MKREYLSEQEKFWLDEQEASNEDEKDSQERRLEAELAENDLCYTVEHGLISLPVDTAVNIIARYIKGRGFTQIHNSGITIEIKGGEFESN